MPSIQELLERDFSTIPALLATQAAAQPTHPAVVHGNSRLDFASLNALVDRVAASLQRDGIQQRQTIAICGASSIPYVAVFLGALRAGIAAVPLAPGSTPDSLRGMLADCGAACFFVDRSVAQQLGAADPQPSAAGGLPALVGLDFAPAAGAAFESWLAPEGTTPQPVEIGPDDPFNIIYSSGTTGLPKGIVQPHGMRWGHVRRGGDSGYGPESTTLVSTPLYSNTTLVSFFPGLALGGCIVLMAKFDAGQFLELAQRERATHAMLVPVQYQRIMDHPSFDQFDLSSFKMKFCTSAPFKAELKQRVLDRWPGGLVEYYGMTEGGGTCILPAHLFPNKLHTVGVPVPGHDIRVIDDAGRELPRGEIGEVVGSSKVVMLGYHNQPGKTSEAEWYDPTGKRFIRTGDVGRFDEDGFLTLLDRKKDMIISGGFNIYPSDLESVLQQHPAVAEAAVVGVASERWGETPVAFVVPKPGHAVTPAELTAFLNERVGKTQRVTDLTLVAALPRSAIGKVLKRELRDSYAAGKTPAAS
ncbi:MAG: class I adenylate-forming enzyme family protein [Polyangiales bacterium]